MATGIDKVYVKVINGPSNDPIDVIFSIAKKSVQLLPTYNEEFLNKFTREEKINFIWKVFNSGHTGIFEHIYYSIEVYGVSRSMTHQAVRNRIASFLETSLRYNDPTKEEFKYVIPVDIRNNESLKEEFNKDMEYITNLYKKWYNKGKELNLPISKCKELGRTVLPQCSAVTYSFTMNILSLIKLFNKRLCTRAEKEFNLVAQGILNELIKELPEIFSKVGSHCEQYGYCPETEYSCGRYPILEEIK